MGDEAFLPLGTHSYRIEGDLVFFRVKGVVALEDMVEILRLVGEVKNEHGIVLTLYDSRENTGLDPAARKYAADRPVDALRVSAAASFGAPFAMRVVVNMLNRAHSLLRSGTTPTVLFDTEAQARAYLQAERARILSSQTA